ncbi:probable dolichyl pyrophosphate Glc1Man9GlcNAc2 alpha-1,3-glucosyltransferase [Mercenaria mercenaria]|uniref:probable dolichyl pyrophosphate Glc1Man9GlcNAc2 alpha-1,3-glucosyltransferase n=1 Tax=Mercenaria mercenaria TaxID=6596 RepID=UPI00234E9181|nr:probable dolichyl pyrophosphate Glc1Man9GlcNAc2 alpha-1,3-glucosyltransferase [Mercenaria mercenaria]
MAAFWSVAAAVSCFKLLLLPSYKSTDFDVHRNWLAITHSLPVRKWYFEETSEWTLDYPPFFAWFEYCLSILAGFFDPEMLKVENIDYRSEATVVFQRLSVIVTDLMYIYALKELYNYFSSSRKKSADTEDILQSPPLIQAAVLLTNFGLIVIDHIHFQYNGFLYGILLLSIVRILQGRNMSAAFWFAVLLNFKHIFLYIAPAYFIYLLRCYVFTSNEDGSLKWRSFSPLRLIGLGIIVVGVFTVSFGPFIILGQVPQVLSRLFPFKRGLCHAYWAPNFWAIYNIADKALAVAGTRLGLLGTENQTASMTGGLVQEFQHTVLPSISPLVTLVLSALSMMPALYLLWIRPKGVQSFLRALILCAFGSFMFGWHVHEKAVLMIIIPLSLLTIDKKKDAQIYLVVSTIGHYSLFPLLFTQFETPIKICLLAFTTLYAFTGVANIFRAPWSYTSLPLLSTPETLYLLGIVPLELYNSVIHNSLGLAYKLPFLPLMLTSIYCAIGVIYCWIRFYWITFYKKSKQKQS